MLFAAIGKEWARRQRIGPGERHAVAEGLVRSAPAISIPEQWAKYIREHSMELSGC